MRFLAMHAKVSQGTQGFTTKSTEYTKVTRRGYEV